MSKGTLSQGHGDVILYEEKDAPPASPRIQSKGCTTMQQNCAGMATFHNTQYEAISYAIYYANQVTGTSDFVLKKGESAQYFVQTGDTYAAIPGNTGVPNGTPRAWITVG